MADDDFQKKIIEEAWGFCQKVLQINPVIVVGSGSSAAYGLPTMWDLGQHLIAAIDGAGVPAGGEKFLGRFQISSE